MSTAPPTPATPTGRSTPSIEQQLTQAAEWIASADGLLIAAGAGIGIDSGLPDFRGKAGFWRAYPALKKGRLPFDRIASPDAFRRLPSTAWGFYGHRLNLYRATQPHAGFALLRTWGARMPHGCFVYTSNVDGQFHKAGFPESRIVECHGSIHRLQCVTDCAGHLWSAANFHPQVHEATCQLQSELPRCPHCGALARPNILLFNDGHWNDLWTERQHMLLDAWLGSTPPPLVIEIGAGRAIATVRHFSQRMQQRGSRLIRINPDDARVNNAHAIELSLGARDALEQINALLV
ncbi:NAD-dependent deacetylase [Acidovorax sp. HDW3]|uniref:SIR2 family NAD-dependent protein deacylase n=1 Tax=Acidovorax sp. HDW3 TaxID=2714923 RepID=UPI0014096047|nr:Sir2 family NAD-dependent protein deacetylase [Acidovorax sp. HDW3]QIL44463.1 NAD-dependent deacetylase [Acidovorax sp. HDW3]